MICQCTEGYDVKAPMMWWIDLSFPDLIWNEHTWWYGDRARYIQALRAIQQAIQLYNYAKTLVQYMTLLHDGIVGILVWYDLSLIIYHLFIIYHYHLFWWNVYCLPNRMLLRSNVKWLNMVEIMKSSSRIGYPFPFSLCSTMKLFTNRFWSVTVSISASPYLRLSFF